MIMYNGPWKDNQQYVFYNINVNVHAEKQLYYAVFQTLSLTPNYTGYL